jgi:hypothetical protein
MKIIREVSQRHRGYRQWEIEAKDGWRAFMTAAQIEETFGVNPEKDNPDFMLHCDALELVLDLARQNALELKNCETEELQAEYHKQQVALDTVEDYIVNHCEEEEADVD